VNASNYKMVIEDKISSAIPFFDRPGGAKIKSIGTLLWRSPNTYTRNESGFSDFPGGLRLDYARFVYLESNEGGWWSTSEPPVNSTSNANLRRLEYNNGEIRWNGYPKKSGFSVVYIKD